MELNQPSRPQSAAPAYAQQTSNPSTTNAETRLSYKFQRLRERLRASIDSGELSGKLPGERQLARRFRVNAKTLSKALTDLAAEGVLERSIGRGTFVKGSAGTSGVMGTSTAQMDRWLIICDEAQATSVVVRKLIQRNPGAQIIQDISSLRPSFLNTFKAVIDFAPSTPTQFLRDLVVRNMAVVLVGREPTNYSMNAVLLDRVFGANILARDLILAGHRRFLAVERRGCTQVCDAIRSAAKRYAPDVTVDVAFPSEAVGGVELGATAVICDTAESAEELRKALESSQLAIPARVSLAAVGAVDGQPPCTGYFVGADEKVEAIKQVLRDSTMHRPHTVWLTGTFFDVGTTGPTESMMNPASRPSAGAYGAAAPACATNL